MSTVKINPIDKDILEKLQAKLKLHNNIKLDQYKLLGKLIQFGETNYSEFLSFIEGVSLTDSEIKTLKSKLIKNYGFYYPEKSDDDLIYGDLE